MEPMVYIRMKLNYINIIKNNIIEKINVNKKIIGIGETGLDFYYNHSKRKIKSTVLKSIYMQHKKKFTTYNSYKISGKRNFRNIRKHNKKKNFKILIHCFTGTRDFAFKLLT